MTLVATDYDSRAYIEVAVERTNKRLEQHLLRGIVDRKGEFIFACTCGIGLAEPANPLSHLLTVRDADVPKRNK